MKKLENFECEKVEIKTIYGGKEPSMTIVYQGTEVCDVHTDY
ncbi:hypothetical protein [Flavobacterium sp. UBA7680]|nr:hypothetical protein [Flavobacterium sp. UBA7680]